VMVAAYSGTVDIVLLPTRSRKRVSKVLAEKMFYGSQALLNDRETEEIMRTLKFALENDVADLVRMGTPPNQVMDIACMSTMNYVVRCQPGTRSAKRSSLLPSSAILLLISPFGLAGTQHGEVLGSRSC